MSAEPARRHGFAWLALTAALALHVTDEALHGFLSVYNPTVMRIREHLPWLPLPTFTFPVWITGLALGILLLLLTSQFVFRGHRWTKPVSYILGVLMTLNGAQHIAVTIYQWQPMPGVYSSPFLIAASLWLLKAAARAQAPPLAMR